MVALADRLALEAVDRDKNLLVPWVLSAAYAYYIKDATILSDATYDELWRRLKDNWASVTHRHKSLIREDLGYSLHYLSEDEYPALTRGATLRLIWDLYNSPEARKTRGRRPA